MNMNQKQQDSLNNTILGLELNMVYIQDRSTSRYLSEDVIKAFKIIEKEQNRLSAQMRECKAIKQDLQHKSHLIDAKLRGYQQLEDKFNRTVNEKINQIRNELMQKESNINKMVNEKINQVRNEQRVRINNISKYLTISNMTLLLMVICFCLAAYFFYQRLNGTDQRLTRQLNMLQLMTQGYKFNETGHKNSNNIKNEKLNEIVIQAEKQEAIKKVHQEQQKQSWERENELEQKLIKASFWWGGSWSELEKKEQLNLGGQNLDGLPEKLYTLKELKQLKLHSNQLVRLPQSLGNLNKMQKLVIFNNPNLKELPKSFKKLKELKELWIDWQLLPKQNIFRTEPFASLKNLQKLYIRSRQFILNSDGKQRKEAIKKECEQNKINVYFIEWQ